MKKTKKTIKHLKLREISSVDRPAQAPALAVIMKRESEDEMSFQDHVKEIQKSAKCSKVAALQKARTLYPDAFAEYQKSGVEAEQALQKSLHAPLRNKTEFDIAVEKLLLSNPGMRRTTAMQRIHDERPDLVADKQAA